MTVPLTHHELCFGCGQANVFGLHLELDPVDGGALAGRFFVKQDHQGPDGTAHPGVIGAALEEAIAHLRDQVGATGDGGESARPLARVEIEHCGPAPVGTYVRIRAWLDRDGGEGAVARALAVSGDDDGPVAAARASLLGERPSGE